MTLKHAFAIFSASMGLLIASPDSSLAEGSFNANAGYIQGSFKPDDAFPISGPHFTVEASYGINMNAINLAGGGLYRYSELTYTSNELGKAARWYYGGAFLSAGLNLSKTAVLRLKTTFAPYSKFFVFSTTSLDLNDSPTEIKESTKFSGNSAFEISFSFLRLLSGEKKTYPLPYVGAEIGSVSQKFTTRKQKIIRDSDAEETVGHTDTTNGSYAISAAVLSFMIGVKF